MKKPERTRINMVTLHDRLSATLRKASRGERFRVTFGPYEDDYANLGPPEEDDEQESPDPSA